MAKFDPEAILSTDVDLRAFARSLSIDPGQSDDVAQDAWLAAIEYRGNPVRSWSGWLKQVVRRLTGKRRVQSRRRSAHERAAARREGVPPADEALEREDVRRIVIDHLRALEEPYRESVILRFLAAQSPEAIAAALKVPAETVRTRIKRGISILRERLERDFGKDGFEARLGILGLTLDRTSIVSRNAGLEAAETLRGALIVTKMSKTAAVAGLAMIAGLVTITSFFFTQVADDRLSVADSRASQDTTPIRRSSGSSAAILGLDETNDAASTANADPQPTVGGTTSLIVRVVAKDGSPAIDIPLDFRALPPTFPRTPSIVHRSDSAGLISVDIVRPGSFDVTCVLGGRMTIDVPAEKAVEATFLLPGTAVVEGIVVDKDDRPRDGVDVHYVNDDQIDHVVGRTGPDGRFTVRRLELNRWERLGFFYATCDEWAPAIGRDATIETDGRRTVRLVLERDPYSLRGTVVTRDGQPIENAEILAGQEWVGRSFTADDRPSRIPCGPRQKTGADGRFEFRGLSRRQMSEIKVRAEKFAPRAIDLGAAPRADTDERIVLSPEAIVEGRCVDKNGRGIADVVLIADRFMGREGIMSARTKSGADGGYRLGGLGDRLTMLVAEHQDFSETEVAVGPRIGEIVRHDITLEDIKSISGRLVQSDDSPLSGYVVEARPYRDQGIGAKVARSAADGRFRCLGCLDIPYRLIVRTQTDPPFILKSIENVRTSTEELTVRLTADELQGSTLIGRILDAQGKVLASATVALFQNDESSAPQIRVDAATGKFAFPPLPPGRYRFLAHADGVADLFLPPITLLPGETRDLGDIRFAASGRIVARLVRDGVAPTDVVFVRARPMDSPKSSAEESTQLGFELVGDRATSGFLKDGKYLVEASGESVARVEVVCDIKGAGDTEIELRLVPGAAVFFHFAPTPGRETTKPTTVTITRVEDSKVVESRTVRRRGDRYEPFSTSLPPGDFSVKVADDEGRSSEKRIRVVAGKKESIRLDEGE